MKIIYNNWVAKLVGLFGFTAIVLFRVCYCNGGEMSDGSKLWKHEYRHYDQQKSDGIWFYLKYIWYTIRYGYKGNPYEIAAREAEGGT